MHVKFLCTVFTLCSYVCANVLEKQTFLDYNDWSCVTSSHGQTRINSVAEDVQKM